MHRHPSPLRAAPSACLLPALLLAASLSGIASADHPIGPPIGNNRFKTLIERGPQGVDRDDFTAILAAGDRLSFTVKSPFQSPLLPVVELLDPTGRDRIGDARLKERSGGKKLVVKRFVVDRTGLWAVRIGGRIETEGAYVVSFKVTAPRRTELDAVPLGAGEDIERTHAVAAVPGSALDIDVTWDKGAAAVQLVSVTDPSGDEVTDDEGRGAEQLVRTKKRGFSLRKLRLPPPTAGDGSDDGSYAIRVRAAAGPTSYRIRWRVRPPERPRGARKLVAIEPFIIRPGSGRFEGVEEQRLRVHGWSFSTGQAPRVIFGKTAGRDVIVDPSGGFLEVTVPPGVDDSLVSIAVINPDDQGSLADDVFYYVPPPVITAVTDRSGLPLVGGSAAGGDIVRIHGEHLRTGQLVTFGPGPEIIPIIRDGQFEVETRVQAPGLVPVRITDSFGHEAIAPQEFEFKAAPTFVAQPYTPSVAAASGGTVILVRGANFEDTDELLFDGDPIDVERISPNILRLTAPARDDGVYSLFIRDRFGLTGSAAPLRCKAPGIIDAVTPVSGTYLGADQVSVHGGAEVALTGSRFHVDDRVTVGGMTAQVTSSAAMELLISVPPAVAGSVDVVVTDAVGQATTVADALQYVGYSDKSATRAASRTTVDDRSALRGAGGDLDADGDADDVVIVSEGSAPGSRSERTRLLLGGATGALADKTTTGLPAANSDASGADDLRASAVAVGDLDGVDGDDIVIAGLHPSGDTYGEVRWLVNDGYGVFTLDEDAVPGSTHAAQVTAEDENGVVHEVLSARAIRGAPTALAIGDLDDDGDLDVVAGRDSFESRRFGVDALHVDFTATPAYVSAADAATYAIDETRYYSGVRVLDNRIDISGALVDVTADAVPSAGDDADATPLPAFHARDLALGDLDDDGDLDLVVTWDDPTTVTAYGLSQGSGTDAARVATRVLLNDGGGTFTDVTSDWMPAGTAPEFFQASRLALSDLDADGDLDLVLVHAVGVDAYQGPPGYNRRALRVLRNDFDASTSTVGFSDVSSTVLPTVAASSNDNLRGGALLVADVDGDGAPDILVATTTPPSVNSNGASTAALRIYSGTPAALGFRENTGFLPPLSTDSGEADDLLLLAGLSTETQPSLVLLSETVPATSVGTRLLRVFDWQR